MFLGIQMSYGWLNLLATRVPSVVRFAEVVTLLQGLRRVPPSGRPFRWGRDLAAGSTSCPPVDRSASPDGDTSSLSSRSDSSIPRSSTSSGLLVSDAFRFLWYDFCYDPSQHGARQDWAIFRFPGYLSNFFLEYPVEIVMKNVKIAL